MRHFRNADNTGPQAIGSSGADGSTSANITRSGVVMTLYLFGFLLAFAAGPVLLHRGMFGRWV